MQSNIMVKQLLDGDIMIVLSTLFLEVCDIAKN